MSDVKSMISNCPLCEEHSLHMAGEEGSRVMQCINCGYVSSSNYSKGKKEEYEKLTDDMKRWSIEKNDRLWIPTVLTLPIGMLYPKDIEEVIGDGTHTKMKWAFAPMVEIAEEEKEKYPNNAGGYYERRIDTDNPTIYNNFFEGMILVNRLMKNKNIDGK